jgi:glycosyltransferase involved in cell wall biosynthesis
LEWISFLRAKGLAELGQEVTLIAAQGSKAPEGVELIQTVPVGGSEEEAFKVYANRLKEWDVIIDDSWQKYSYLAKMQDESLRIMGVVHSPCPYRTAPPVKFPCFVGVSSAHAKYLSERLRIPVRVAYNGLDLNMYPFQPDVKARKRYLSLNRVMPEKSIHNFIDVIRRARAFGDVVGNDTRLVPDQQYVQRIRNLCDGYYVRYWGEVSNDLKLKLLQHAKATIVLNSQTWLEVFGLMCLESLSVGTPVITLKGIGGPEEIIEDGKSGFIAKDTDEIVEIIKADKVSDLKPEDCRKTAENFTYTSMAKRYLSLTEELLNTGGW